jgi:hypothetical protein
MLVQHMSIFVAATSYTLGRRESFFSLLHAAYFQLFVYTRVKAILESAVSDVLVSVSPRDCLYPSITAS